MKKLLTLTLLLFTLTITLKADVLKLKATAFSFKAYNPETDSWTDWTKWEECSILVVINTDKDIIKVFSKETQDYDIIKYGPEENDGENGNIRTLYYVNEDGNRCNIRLRASNNSDYQMYIDFNDAIIVHNLIERD